MWSDSEATWQRRIAHVTPGDCISFVTASLFIFHAFIIMWSISFLFHRRRCQFIFNYWTIIIIIIIIMMMIIKRNQMAGGGNVSDSVAFCLCCDFFVCLLEEKRRMGRAGSFRSHSDAKVWKRRCDVTCSTIVPASIFLFCFVLNCCTDL